MYEKPPPSPDMAQLPLGTSNSKSLGKTNHPQDETSKSMECAEDGCGRVSIEFLENRLISSNDFPDISFPLPVPVATATCTFVEEPLCPSVEAQPVQHGLGTSPDDDPLVMVAPTNLKLHTTEFKPVEAYDDSSGGKTWQRSHKRIPAIQLHEFVEGEKVLLPDDCCWLDPRDLYSPQCLKAKDARDFPFLKELVLVLCLNFDAHSLVYSSSKYWWIDPIFNTFGFISDEWNARVEVIQAIDVVSRWKFENIDDTEVLQTSHNF